jgi:hypothetical protein
MSQCHIWYVLHTRSYVLLHTHTHMAGYFALGAGKSFTRGLSQPDAELSSEVSS